MRFPANRLVKLSEIEPWHFWFVARRELVDRLLARHAPGGLGCLLDVGCGTGANLPVLKRHARQVVGLDYEPEGLRDVRSASPDMWRVRGDATRLPFPAGRFDAVTMLDVLEHVGDETALAEIRRVLRPGGVAVITVPAIPWLWSHRDDEARHLRRYRRRQLIDLFRSCRLDLCWLNYYQCLLFPLVMARVLWRRSAAGRDLEERRIPLLNTVFGWINRCEIRLSPFVTWPFGSSLVAVCRKTRA